MTAPFPHHYAATVRRAAGGRGFIDAGPRPQIEGGPPPEFGGSDVVWSPEHLLLGAIGLCLETTFEALAKRDRLVVDDWHATVGGTVDRTTGGLAFTAISATIHIDCASDRVERTRAVADRARHCLVSASLRCPIDVVVVVTASDSRESDAEGRSVTDAALHVDPTAA